MDGRHRCSAPGQNPAYRSTRPPPPKTRCTSLDAALRTLASCAQPHRECCCACTSHRVMKQRRRTSMRVVDTRFECDLRRRQTSRAMRSNVRRYVPTARMTRETGHDMHESAEFFFYAFRTLAVVFVSVMYRVMIEICLISQANSCSNAHCRSSIRSTTSIARANGEENSCGVAC